MNESVGNLQPSEDVPANNPSLSAEKKGATVYVAESTRVLAQTLAETYGTSQAQTVRAALLLLEERRQEIDLIQVPELVAEVTDLEVAVRALIGQGEQLEKLVVEALESQAVPPPRET